MLIECTAFEERHIAVFINRQWRAKHMRASDANTVLANMENELKTQIRNGPPMPRDLAEADPVPLAYAPKYVRAQTASALQMIAASIIELTWHDAEEMGAGIKEKLGTDQNLTAAIQSWAESYHAGTHAQQS